MEENVRVIDGNALFLKLRDRMEGFVDGFNDPDHIPEKEKIKFEECLECAIMVGTEETVDAQQVVRCKDCAVPHNKWIGCPNLNGLVTSPDFYCAFGERKKND